MASLVFFFKQKNGGTVIPDLFCSVMDWELIADFNQVKKVNE